MSFITKTFYTVLVFLFSAHLAFSANIAIIESQSFHPMQVMDTKWYDIATAQGHTATVFSQTVLDDLNNLNGFDILILSNGLVNVPANRQTTMTQFVSLGGSAYIQAEYQITQPGNEVFANVINGLGGSFSWTGESNGNLIPMNVSGDLATMNGNNVSTVDHFWYGAYGSGDQYTIPFLEFQDEHYGFIYCSPDPAHGKLITTSDQDWIRLDYSLELAENIMAFLALDNSFSVPSIFISVSNDQPCIDEPVTYVANLGPTTADVTYQWVVNGTNVPGATEDGYTAVFQEGDMVSVNINFDLGCAHAEVTSPPLEVIIIYPLTNTPVVTIDTPTESICEGAMVSVEATTTDLQGLDNVTHQWTLNGEPIDNADDAIYETNTLQTGDVIACLLSYTTPCNGDQQIISNTFTFDVTPSVTPTLTIFADFTDICAGEQVTFSAQGTDLGNNTTYQWTIDGTPVGTNQPTFSSSSITNAQTVNCIATVTDMTMCLTAPTATANEIIINVTDSMTPEISIQANQTEICEGEIITFEATGSGLGNNPTYQWFFNGVPVGPNQSTFETANIADGHEVSCLVTSNANCVTTTDATSETIVITVNSTATPTALVNASHTITCVGSNVSFNVIGENIGATPTYQWYANGNPVGDNLPTYNTTITEAQNVYCIITTMNDCLGQVETTSNEVEITIGDVFIELVNISSERCEQGNGAISITASGGLAPYTYTWDNNTNNTNQLNDLTAGTYAVTISDANGCETNGSFTVENMEGVGIAEIMTDNINCEGLGGSATVVMENENADYFYSWKNEDGDVIASSKEIQNLQEGLYIVEVTDAFGCSSIEEIYIEPNAPLYIEILEDTRIKLGEDYQLQVLTNADLSTSTITWEADETLSCIDCMTPTAKPTETTVYFATVTTAAGCTAKAIVKVWVEKPKEVFIPNAFSPNNDGMNDVLTIYGGKDVVKVKAFKIVNRWGEVVFSNEDFNVNDETQGWKGYFKSKIAVSGVYVYFAEIEFLDGTTEVFKGDVTITK